MEYSALSVLGELVSIEGEFITFKMLTPLNEKRIETVLFESDQAIQAEIELLDPRVFTGAQRRLVYALLGDIYKHTGQPLEALKEQFKWVFEAYTQRTVSLSKESKSSISDVTLYIDIILNYMFEFGVPFSKGYEILPENQDYFFYKCIEKRVCFNCGKQNADIHHVDAVGMGSNRKKVDHAGRRYMALCRGCHTTIHIEGYTEFVTKRLLKPIRLNEVTLRRLGIF